MKPLDCGVFRKTDNMVICPIAGIGYKGSGVHRMVIGGVMSPNLLYSSGFLTVVVVWECPLPVTLCASKLLGGLQTIEFSEEPDMIF